MELNSRSKYIRVFYSTKPSKNAIENYYSTLIPSKINFFYSSMDLHLQHIFNIGTFIGNTLKRALRWEPDDCNYGKRLPTLHKYDSMQLQTFIRIFDHPVIQSFLRFDICNLLADKYLIAIVFIYLNRAQISFLDYDIHYFLSALYLAHEMEEDNEELRKRIILWYPGKSLGLKTTALHYFKNKIWMKMNFNCYVTKETCDNLIRETSHWNVWNRQREQSHSGAFHVFEFKNTECKHCRKPCLSNPLMSPDKNNNYEEDECFTTSDWEIDSDTNSESSE